MKRTFANHIKQSLAAMCLVLGVFLFSATSVEAQAGSGASDIGINLNWKASALAQPLLVQAILDLHSNQQVSVVGSQPYILVNYYKGIYGNISDGSSTWQASRDALNQFSGSMATQLNTTGVVLNASQKEALFQQAVQLLTD